jgi:hypothetical protein
MIIKAKYMLKIDGKIVRPGQEIDVSNDRATALLNAMIAEKVSKK